MWKVRPLIQKTRTLGKREIGQNGPNPGKSHRSKRGLKMALRAMTSATSRRINYHWQSPRLPKLQRGHQTSSSKNLLDLLLWEATKALWMKYRIKLKTLLWIYQSSAHTTLRRATFTGRSHVAIF